MQVYESIQKRFSIRRYKNLSIPKDHIKTLFNAMQLAPSANNGQNWEFVFVDNPGLKQRLVPACLNQNFLRTAHILLPGGLIQVKNGIW